MRFSSNILFLGCWLARQMWVSTGHLYPKPSISVNPSEVVTLGENATIHCKNEQYQNPEFYLKKQGVSHLRTLASQKAEQYEAVFPVSNAKHSDGGVYWCTYCIKTDCDPQSDSSDRVYINITDPHLSKPSIKVRPREQLTPGMKVTIECRGWQREFLFALFKSGDLLVSYNTESGADMAEFPIFGVMAKDEGNYTCRYHFREYPFVWSVPSDPVELVLRATAPGVLETNIRLGVASLVLLALILILIEAMYSWRS